MKFKFIRDELSNSGLVLIDIDFLKLDSSQYTLDAIQPNSCITTSNNDFSNSSSSNVEFQFNTFFELVDDSNSDLVLSPEYSCPIKVFEETIISNNKFPNEGKLWVIGTDSIPKSELSQYINKLQESGHTVIYEQTNDTKNFYDPVFLLFNAKDSDGVTEKVIFIQFKTQHMGVWTGDADYEKNNMIEGETVYILNNDEDSTSFMTIICSDAISFKNLDLSQRLPGNWIHKPYIIAHLQLNPEPNHQDFVEFRKKIIETQNKTIISLNHGTETTFSGHKIIKYPGTAYYLSSSEIKLNDATICADHKTGLYINKGHANKYKYIISPNLDIFSLSLDRPSHASLPATISRNAGCTMLKMIKVNSNNTKSILQEIEDKFQDFITSLGYNITPPIESDVCSIERMLCLSIGQVNTSKDIIWFQPQNLKTFRLGALDDSRRPTVNINNGSDAIRFKKDTIINYFKLKDIINDQNNFSDIRPYDGFEINKLELKFPTSGSSKNYSYNITDGQNKGLACYIGPSSLEDASKAHLKLRNILPEGNEFLLIVWFEHGGSVQSYAIKQDPKITHNPDNYSGTITDES